MILFYFHTGCTTKAGIWPGLFTTLSPAPRTHQVLSKHPLNKLILWEDDFCFAEVLNYTWTLVPHSLHKIQLLFSKFRPLQCQPFPLLLFILNLRSIYPAFFIF